MYPNRWNVYIVPWTNSKEKGVPKMVKSLTWVVVFNHEGFNFSSESNKNIVHHVARPNLFNEWE